MDNLTSIFELLNFWRVHGKPNSVEGFTAKALLNYFVDVVIQVITEILDKLLYKAINKYQIIELNENAPDEAAF